MLSALISYMSGRTYSLTSSPSLRFLRSFFVAGLFTLRVFTKNLLKGNCRRNIFFFPISFWWLIWHTKPSFTSNKHNKITRKFCKTNEKNSQQIIGQLEIESFGKNRETSRHVTGQLGTECVQDCGNHRHLTGLGGYNFVWSLDYEKTFGKRSITSTQYCPQIIRNREEDMNTVAMHAFIYKVTTASGFFAVRVREFHMLEVCLHIRFFLMALRAKGWESPKVVRPTNVHDSPQDLLSVC